MIGRFPIGEITGTWPLWTIGFIRSLQASTARAVHAHPAGAADHHPAALAVRERPVVAGP